MEKGLGQHALSQIASLPRTPARRSPAARAAVQPSMIPLRVLHLNSMLKGGGTDDRSVRIAHALLKLGHQVCMSGPDGREFSKIARDLGLPFYPIRVKGL